MAENEKNMNAENQEAQNASDIVVETARKYAPAKKIAIGATVGALVGAAGVGLVHFLTGISKQPEQAIDVEPQEAARDSAENVIPFETEKTDEE